MTITPQEPGSDPEIVPSSDPDPIHVDPIAPGEPDETGDPERRERPEEWIGSDLP